MYRQSEKNLLSSNISSTCPHSMVNGPLVAEIVSLVWGTPANFNWFGILAALLHGTLVVGVSHTLRRWTEGATYVRQGDHHVGHWPTFSIFISCKQISGSYILSVWFCLCRLPVQMMMNMFLSWSSRSVFIRVTLPTCLMCPGQRYCHRFAWFLYWLPWWNFCYGFLLYRCMYLCEYRVEK